jgi:hypothetical protein
MRRRKLSAVSSAAALQKKLTAYALAGGALVPGQEALATVVYTDPADIEVFDSSFGLDLNDDDTVDFTITHVFGVSLPFLFGDLSVTGTGTNGVVGFYDSVGERTFASALDGSQVIAGNLTFQSNAEMASASKKIKVDEDVDGPWAGANNKFLGLRFDIGGSDHFGWARLSVGEDASATIHDWAYESVAGASIHALAAVPESGSLGVLAMGALGVGAWLDLRKRRKEATSAVADA